MILIARGQVHFMQKYLLTQTQTKEWIFANYLLKFITWID